MFMNDGILFGVSAIQTRPPVLFLVIISWHGHDPDFVKKQSKIIKETRKKGKNGPQLKTKFRMVKKGIWSRYPGGLC